MVKLGNRRMGVFISDPKLELSYGFDDNADPAQKTQFRFNRRN